MAVGRLDPTKPLSIAIREFVEGRAQTPDDDAIWIFWEAQQSVSAGPARTDDAVLKCLDSLYERHRVPYEPDDGRDNLVELLTFLHIAAARAFKVKERSGLSDEVTVCLYEVERAMETLAIEFTGPADPPDLTEGFASVISAVATSGIVFVELSKICRSEHRYTDALTYLAKATRYYDEAAECNAVSLDPSIWDSRLEVETRLQHRLEAHLDTLEFSLEDAKDLFEQVRTNRRRDDDWRQVADECRALMNALHVSGIDEEIQDERGDVIGWREYWNGAQTWARTQLSPTGLQEYQMHLEETAAGDRMRLYFFGETWNTLGHKTQAAILNADLLMHSKERGQRLGTVLNELQVATEEVFNWGVWYPLATVKATEWITELDEFEQRRAETSGSMKGPGLRDYVWVCDRPFFGKFLECRGVGCPEIAFLTQDLPELCRSLLRLRNAAQHDLGREPSRTVVDCVYKAFLGIGRLGVLPELTRIGTMLRRDGPRRRK